MADTLAYGEEPVAPEMTNLDTTNTSPLSDTVLNDRANRADYAMGDKSPGQPALKDAFRQGQEPAVRQQAAANANLDFQQQKLDYIKAATYQGAPVSDTQVNTIMSLGTTPEANPGTVLEDQFGKNMVAAGVTGSANLVFQSAFDTTPDKTREGVQVATAAVSRKLQAKDVEEQTKAAYDALPWFGGDDTTQTNKAGNLLVTLATGGLATYVNQRNLLNSSPTNSFLPGSNKLEQIQYLYLLPHNEFKPALMAAAGPGSPLWKANPSDAMDFIHSAVQFGTSDAYADNLMGIVNVSGLLPIGTAGNALRRVFVGGKRTAEGVTAATHLEALNNASDILSQSSKAPTVPLSAGGEGAASTAQDILGASSKPQAPGYYVPKAAIGKTTYVGSKDAGQFVPDFTSQVSASGEPKIFNKDGFEVQLSRTPQEGHFPVNVTPGSNQKTFRTSRGNTYEVQNDGTTTRDKAGGHVDGKSGPQPQSEQTVYLNSKQLDQWSEFQAIEPNGARKAIDTHENGKMGIIYETDKDAGKFEKRTMTAPATEPAKGLYPVELWDNGRKVHFGNKITSVEENKAPGLTLGPEIVPKEDVQARVALADIVKSQGETDVQDVLSKMGQHDTASQVGAKRTLDDRLSQTAHPNDVEAIRRAVPSIGSPQLYYNNASSLTRERADRLAQQATQSSLELTQAITDPARVERLTEAAKDRAIEIAKQQVSQKYNRNADAILDQVEHWDSATNLHYVETRFGKKDGTLFDTFEQATHYKNLQYKIGNAATVRQEGTEFYISHVQHADETQTGVRNSLIVSGNETPRGWWNSLLTAVTGKFAPLGNSIRSSASTLAPFQMNNRVISTHAPSIMRDAIENVAKDINTLGKWTTSERQEMQTILEHNRDYMSPDGVRGQFYKDALSFETAFNDRFGKMPTEKQVVAYDQFTRLSDLDWTLRELDLMRDKGRLGVRNYRVSQTGKDELGLPQSVKTDWFNGKLVKDFDPVNTQNANVYVMGDGMYTKFGQNGRALPEYVRNKLKANEMQIIQTYNPREKPLMEVTGVKDDIHFVVTDKYEDKQIAFGENVPYRPGGHVIHQDQHYIKQPMIGPGTLGRDTHFGDTSIKAFSTEREAKDWADKYNIVRNLIRTNDNAGLDVYVAAGHMPETVPELKRMFSDGTLSTEHPIVHTFAGRDTFQSSEELARQYPGLKDQFSSYNLSQVQGGDFLADRGTQLDTIANKGTEANPLYTNVPSRLFDPYTSLQKGMAQIVRSRWMADYKISAAESWVQEFGHLFDQSKLPIEKLRQNPVYWLYHAEGNIDAGVMKTNPELVTAALTSRKNIMNFLGSRDEVGSLIEGLQKKMVNSIAGYSPTLARKAEETFLPAITSAPEYARQAAFSFIMGNWNPVQLFQQAQGLVHVFALAPTHAWESTTASALVRMYRHTENPEILSSAADKAAAFGWDRDHFLEAMQGWKSTGTHKIGGETSLLSTTGDPQLFKNGWQTFVNKGNVFFNMGESVVRDVSWFTAYREWKAANPEKVLDNRALGDIGNRFQTLSLDMTRASNSALNEGILSIPTQFWTWNARFTEQMLGKRLTMGEKARVATAYAALYGIPATLGGITFGAIPYANYGDIREYALANNYPVSDKGYQLISEGIPSAILNGITGHETSLQRFGPNATQLKDILDGKKDAYEMLGGASGSFVSQVAKTVWPAMMYGFSAIKKDSGFPLKMNDLTNLAENVSTFKLAKQAVVAWNQGQYISKTEGLLDGDIDKYEAAALGLGLNPQRVNDAYTKLDFIKHQEQAQKFFSKKMVEDWTLGMKAAQQGDYQGLVDYMTRVQASSASGNFTKQQEIDVFKQAMHGNESLVDSVEQRFREAAPALQDIPEFKKYIENQH